MILVIDRSLRDGNTVADIFSYMGLLAHAVKPQDAASAISHRYRSSILPHPEDIIDLPDFISRYRAFSGGIPVFALHETPKSFAFASLFDGVFAENSLSSTVLDGMRRFCREHELPLPGNYRLCGIDASVTKREVFYFDDVLHLTKTETAILRFLIRAYPLGLSATEMLDMLFRPSKRPEASDIRTHISSMNKKFRALTGRALIFMTPHIGYRISTPENDPNRNGNPALP